MKTLRAVFDRPATSALDPRADWRGSQHGTLNGRGSKLLDVQRQDMWHLLSGALGEPRSALAVGCTSIDASALQVQH